MVKCQLEFEKLMPKSRRLQKATQAGITIGPRVALTPGSTDNYRFMRGAE